MVAIPNICTAPQPKACSTILDQTRCRPLTDRSTDTMVAGANGWPIILGVTAIETRELKADDWPVWRKLRQSALTEAPEAFGSVLADWTGAGDTEQRWRARLRDVPVNLVIALDGEPAGMVSITAPDTDGTVEMISMWVTPEARGRGVGDEAVRHAITRAAQRFPRCAMTLSVKTVNRHAIALYQRHGFVDAGLSPHDASEHRMRR